MCIGIIDKGSEGRDVQPGKIWADGNTWFLDGLKSIPENLDDFRRRLPINYLLPVIIQVS